MKKKLYTTQNAIVKRLTGNEASLHQEKRSHARRAQKMNGLGEVSSGKGKVTSPHRVRVTRALVAR